jgi:hypothetical protein
MPLSELPTLKALVDRGHSGRPKHAGGDLPCCPKCESADGVELEGRSGACGLWFRCERCDAMFFGNVPT